MFGTCPIHYLHSDFNHPDSQGQSYYSIIYEAVFQPVSHTSPYYYRHYIQKHYSKCKPRMLSKDSSHILNIEKVVQLTLSVETHQRTKEVRNNSEYSITNTYWQKQIDQQAFGYYFQSFQHKYQRE